MGVARRHGTGLRENTHGVSALGGADITHSATSQPQPNIGLEPTPYSVRCAPASRRGSGPALAGLKSHRGGNNALA
jgi:hypothetical protein